MKFKFLNTVAMVKLTQVGVVEGFVARNRRRCMSLQGGIV